MRDFHRLPANFSDAAADPRLQGIAHRLDQLLAPQLDTKLPERLERLVAQLNAHKAYGPDRDNG